MNAVRTKNIKPLFQFTYYSILLFALLIPNSQFSANSCELGSVQGQGNSKVSEREAWLDANSDASSSCLAKGCKEATVTAEDCHQNGEWWECSVWADCEA